MSLLQVSHCSRCSGNWVGIRWGFNFYYWWHCYGAWDAGWLVTSSVGLNLEMLNFFWCWHFNTSSDLLFKRVILSTFKIDSFSSNQRSHGLAPIIYVAVCFKISHSIVKTLFISLRSQMYLASFRLHISYLWEIFCGFGIIVWRGLLSCLYVLFLHCWLLWYLLGKLCSLFGIFQEVDICLFVASYKCQWCRISSLLGF